MARLFFTIGKEQGVRANDIIDAIARRPDIPKQMIKGVSIFETFTFVEVPRDSAEKIIEMMHRSMISGRQVADAPAKPKGARKISADKFIEGRVFQPRAIFYSAPTRGRGPCA